MSFVPISGNEGFSNVVSNQVSGITDYLDSAINLSDNSAAEKAFNYLTGPIYIQTRPDLLKKQVLYTPIEFSNAVATDTFVLLDVPGLTRVTTNILNNNRVYKFPRNCIILKVIVESDNNVTSAGTPTFDLYTAQAVTGTTVPAGPAVGYDGTNLHRQTPLANVNMAGGASNEVGGGAGCNAPVVDGSSGLAGNNGGNCNHRDGSGMIGDQEGRGLSPWDGSHVNQNDVVGLRVNTAGITSGSLKVTVWWYDVDYSDSRILGTP
jgi:hypothetical protein